MFNDYNFNLKGHSYLTSARAKKRFSSNYPNRYVAYKYLHKADIKYWRAGSIKIDTLESFASQESQGGKADPLEINYSCDSVRLKDGKSAYEKRVIRNLDALGQMKVEGAFSDLLVEGLSTTRKNRYVYCLGERFDPQTFKTWKKTEGYDAVLKIRDLRQFMTAIDRADNLGDKRLHNSVLIDWVLYCPFPMDLGVHELNSYKFYKNQTEFGWQREIRLSWKTVSNTSDRGRLAKGTPPYFLNIPNLMDLVKIMEIPSDWTQ